MVECVETAVRSERPEPNVEVSGYLYIDPLATHLIVVSELPVSS